MPTDGNICIKMEIKWSEVGRKQMKIKWSEVGLEYKPGKPQGSRIK